MSDEGLNELMPGTEGRPNHADFWKLSEIIRKHDGRSREGDDKDFRSMISDVIDMESLCYTADQRAIRSMFPNVPESVITVAFMVDRDALETRARLMALWIDAFLAGAEYGKQKAER